MQALRQARGERGAAARQHDPLGSYVPFGLSLSKPLPPHDPQDPPRAAVPRHRRHA